MSLTDWRNGSPGQQNLHDSGLVRRSIDWSEILAMQTDGSSTEMAARILGDLHCYNAKRANYVRPLFWVDVCQLAHAIDALRPLEGKGSRR